MDGIIYRSALGSRMREFVRLRQSQGFRYLAQSGYLLQFDRFLCRIGFGNSLLDRAVIERYVCSLSDLAPRTRSGYISVVRQFSAFLRQSVPSSYVPEPLKLAGSRRLRLPHIYTTAEIESLLKAAGALTPRGSSRPITYYALIGLLYSTGMRLGEALALNRSDFDFTQQALYVRNGKFGKSRWVPLSDSASKMLRWYIRKRPEAVRCYDPLFMSLRKRRLRRSTAYHTFRDLLRECGLRPGKAPTGPRIHDLRHTFAVTRLLQWYKSGENLHALLPALAAYMGHSDVMHTQVYLSATAELLGQASERFLAHFRSPVVDKGQNHE